MMSQTDALAAKLRKLAGEARFDDLCCEFALLDQQDLTVELRLLKSRAIRLASECDIPLEVVEDVLLDVLRGDQNNIEAMIELAHYYIIQRREEEARDVYLKALRAHKVLENDLARLRDFLECSFFRLALWSAR